MTDDTGVLLCWDYMHGCEVNSRYICLTFTRRAFRLLNAALIGGELEQGSCAGLGLPTTTNVTGTAAAISIAINNPNR